MDPDAYAKNNKPETGGDIGIYQAPNSKETLWASSFPQADALLRQGWTKVEELPSKEEIRKLHLNEEALANPGVESAPSRAKTGTVVGESQGTSSKKGAK